jgi:membrane-associated HD superfamily phosphohydrolase
MATLSAAFGIFMMTLWVSSLATSTIYSGATFSKKKQDLQDSLDAVDSSMDQYKKAYTDIISQESASYQEFLSQMSQNIDAITDNHRKLNDIQRNFSKTYKIIQLTGLVAVIVVFGLYLVRAILK